MSFAQNVSAVSPLGEALDGSRRRRQRAPSPRRESDPIRSIVVRNDVWQAAMEIMRQRPDAKMTVVSERRVVIYG